MESRVCMNCSICCMIWKLEFVILFLFTSTMSSWGWSGCCLRTWQASHLFTEISKRRSEHLNFLARINNCFNYLESSFLSLLSTFYLSVGRISEEKSSRSCREIQFKQQWQYYSKWKTTIRFPSYNACKFWWIYSATIYSATLYFWNRQWSIWHFPKEWTRFRISYKWHHQCVL